METTKIPLSACVESSYQNRKELGDVSELARSIEVNGQITPSSWWATADPTSWSPGTAARPPCEAPGSRSPRGDSSNCRINAVCARFKNPLDSIDDGLRIV